MPGPPPKRSNQRRRRNKPDVEIQSASSDGVVRGPELKGPHSAIGKRFWEGLRRSGQAQFFQDSDWAAAELTVLAIDEFVKKPSAMMLASINSAMSNLLVTEGDRRRVRLELGGPEVEEVPDDVARIDEYRRRLESG